MDKSMKIAVVLSAYDKMSTVINSAMDKAQSKINKIKKGINSFGTFGVVGGGVATAFFASTLKAAEENEIAVNRLNQVYKSMGQNVEQASKQSQAYASTLEMQIGVEDETILAVQAKIATFKTVSNEAGRMAGIMDRATKAAFDMQATGFGEASGNAVQLGKALEDPVKGITALRKAGITFTEAEKKKIQVLVDGNKKLEAQKYILAAIEKQVGGVAEATAPASAKMKVAWSEVTESIGKALLPTIAKLATYIGSTIIPKIQAFTDKHPGLIKVLAATSVALLVVGTAIKVVNVIMATNPIVFIITAIATAAFLIYKNWGKISDWFKNLWDKVTGVFKKVWNFIKNLFLNYTPTGLIYKNWGKITAWFSNLWEKVKNVFNGVWQWIKNLFLNYTPMGLIYKHWDEITAYFSGLWDSVKNVFNNVWKWIESAATRMYEAGKNIIKSLWKGIKSVFGAGDDPVMEKMNATIAAAQNINDRTFSVNSNKNLNVTGGASFAPNTLRPVPVSNNNSTVKFQPVINYTGSGSPQDVAAFGTMVQDDFTKRMENYNQQKARKSF